MYTIHDIMEYLNFDSISENIQSEIVFADSQPSIIMLGEYRDNEIIFEYSPDLKEKYPSKYDTEEIAKIVEEILEDVEREYCEQTSLIHAIELGEQKFKNKRE